LTDNFSASSYLISTSQHLLLLDSDDQIRVVHSGKGTYFGLAQEHGTIYVACRNRTSLGSDASERGSIMTLDACTLDPIGSIKAPFKLRDMHALAVIERNLYVTCTFENMIGVYNIAERTWEKWYPAINPDDRGRDIHHFNSIAAFDGLIHLVAHNRGPSQIWSFTTQLRMLSSVIELGVEAHEALPWGDAIITCSSKEAALVSTNGWMLRTGGYPRGMALSEDTILVGVSQYSPEPGRAHTFGSVLRFNRNWQYVGRFVLEAVGQVCAILPITIDQAQCAKWPLLPLAQFHTAGGDEPAPGGQLHFGNASTGVRYDPSWHFPEGVHRWTAALNSKASFLVNQCERRLKVTAFSDFPGPYSLELRLDGASMGGTSLGFIRWKEPGQAEGEFELPDHTKYAKPRLELTFRVPHLWRPSDFSPKPRDTRLLGVAISEVRLCRG